MNMGPGPGSAGKNQPKDGEQDNSSQPDVPELLDDVLNMLEHIHPPGSFDMDISTHGGITVVHVTDRPEYVQKTVSPGVAQDLATMDQILRVAESKPEVGDVFDFTVAGQTFPLEFTDMESLLGLARLGFQNLGSGRPLTEAEREAAQPLLKRYEALCEPPTQVPPESDSSNEA